MENAVQIKTNEDNEVSKLSLSEEASNTLASLISNRNTKFHLNLADATLVGVLESCCAFHRKTNPKYKNDSVVSMIKKLEESIGDTIMPIDVTDDFYVTVQKYLLTTPNERGKTIKPSTIQTYFSIIQSTLEWASKHQCPISETYNCWKVNSYERPRIALTTSMIAYIYKFNFKSPYNRARIKKELENFTINRFSFSMMERVRDQFVLECNLGQRYSDASNFDRNNFNESGTIYHCTQQKTGSRAVVNIMEHAIDKKITLKLLKKYNYISPAKGIDINASNKYLHLLCKCIGDEFDEEIEGENKILGTIVKEKYKLWQLITTHTARRTFITYWVNDEKMSIAKLQKCTGHKDVRQISRYTVEEILQLLSTVIITISKYVKNVNSLVNHINNDYICITYYKYVLK